MGKIHEGIKTFNTTVRTVLAATFVGVIGAGSYYGYSEYSKHERALATATAEAAQLKSELIHLNEELKKKSEQIEKMETSMRLLKTDQRLARLNVLDVHRDEKTGAVTSKLEFVELSPNREPISRPKQLELLGQQVYIDNWIVKFDDSYVEKGDVQRAVHRWYCSSASSPTKSNHQKVCRWMRSACVPRPTVAVARSASSNKNYGKTFGSSRTILPKLKPKAFAPPTAKLFPFRSKKGTVTRSNSGHPVACPSRRSSNEPAAAAV